MGWNSVIYGSAMATPAILSRCCDLFNNSIPGIPANQQITPPQLRHRLMPDPGPNRYQEAGESVRRPVFHLEIWANDGKPDDNGAAPANPNVSIQIALAFHMVLNRVKADTPTVADPANSAPQKRWWVITVGVPQAVQGTPGSYQYIQPRCLAFYRRLRSSLSEWLVLLENNARWPPPIAPPAYEVDNVYLQMTNDGTVAVSALPNAPLAPWPPYDTLLPGGSTLNGVRLLYTGP